MSTVSVTYSRLSVSLPDTALTSQKHTELNMAGLPPSPAFLNGAANADPVLNTGAVLPGAMTSASVGRETLRKRKAAIISDSTHGTYISHAEVGQAACREAAAIAQMAPVAVAPAWFVPALN